MKAESKLNYTLRNKYSLNSFLLLTQIIPRDKKKDLTNNIQEHFQQKQFMTVQFCLEQQKCIDFVSSKPVLVYVQTVKSYHKENLAMRFSFSVQ